MNGNPALKQGLLCKMQRSDVLFHPFKRIFAFDFNCCLLQQMALSMALIILHWLFLVLVLNGCTQPPIWSLWGQKVQEQHILNKYVCATNLPLIQASIRVGLLRN